MQNIIIVIRDPISIFNLGGVGGKVKIVSVSGVWQSFYRFFTVKILKLGHSEGFWGGNNSTQGAVGIPACNTTTRR